MNGLIFLKTILSCKKYSTKGMFKIFIIFQLSTHWILITLKSIGSTCFNNILWEVTLKSYKSISEYMHKPSLYQNMKENESFTTDILTWFKIVQYPFIPFNIPSHWIPKSDWAKIDKIYWTSILQRVFTPLWPLI